MTNKSSNFPPEVKIDLYDQLIATNPDIEHKGKTSPYTSHHGHMFSYLSKTGSMGLRLTKEEREAFLEKFNTTSYESCGAIMKEHITVPDEILQNTEELKVYFDLSYEYIKTLKPKPTKKKQ